VDGWIIVLIIFIGVDILALSASIVWGLFGNHKYEQMMEREKKGEHIDDLNYIYWKYDPF